MVIPLPTLNELEDYQEGDPQQAIQWAADLFYLATGVTTTEGDFEARLVKFAILDMAWAITSRHESREDEFSPFSSERLGSYSYSKAAKSIESGSKTGISNFDAAVAYFLAQAMGGNVNSSDTEWVFKRGFNPDSPLIASHDPSMVGYFKAWSDANTLFVQSDNVDVGYDEEGNLFIEGDV